MKPVIDSYKRSSDREKLMVFQSRESLVIVKVTEADRYSQTVRYAAGTEKFRGFPGLMLQRQLE